ncbi:hypothetical protein [Vibrio sagamiensis]|uniref:hypothetical protein n=1 Tax=Vibrio sagamiensis TaxID=512650 RepID=UPI00353091F2
MLFFTALDLAFVQLSSPIFKADALIQIEKKNSGCISEMVGYMGEFFSSEASCTTEMEFLKSRMLVEHRI